MHPLITKAALYPVALTLTLTDGSHHPETKAISNAKIFSHSKFSLCGVAARWRRILTTIVDDTTRSAMPQTKGRARDWLAPKEIFRVLLDTSWISEPNTKSARLSRNELLSLFITKYRKTIPSIVCPSAMKTFMQDSKKVKTRSGRATNLC